MAINRALMNRQMYNMGGSSLETGAPDITLTGDMRPTYSAMRKQRLAGGGIASMRDRIKYDVKPGETLVGKPGGLVEPGVKQYGLLSKIKDKIVDDLIPNEIKENPVLTALGGAALVNQFGIPQRIADYIGTGTGQNFVGNLLSAVVPGSTQFDTVLGNLVPFTGDPYGVSVGDMGGYLTMDSIANAGQGRNMLGMLDPSNTTGWMEQGLTLSPSEFLKDAGQSVLSMAGNAVKNLATNAFNTITGGGGVQTAAMSTPGGRDALLIQQQRQQQLNANLAKALAAGSAAGAYVESQPKDTLPTDTTGIDIPAIAQAARGTDAEAEAAGLRFLPPQDTRLPVAQGGRIGYDIGGTADEGFDLLGEKDAPVFAVDVNPMKENRRPMERIIETYVRDQINQGLSMEQVINNVNKIINKRIPDKSSDFEIPLRDERVQGGRIGYDMGGISGIMASYGYNDAMSDTYDSFLDMKKKGLIPPTMDFDEFLQEVVPEMSKTKEPNRIMAQEGGLMDLGGMEKDYREEGGFVPIGGREKADDVPARLSKNEFVFTADAVRNAGGGDIDEGAAVMERMMKNLEQGGQVSEESQGLEGAREMFETSQRLEKRII